MKDLIESAEARIEESFSNGKYDDVIEGALDRFLSQIIDDAKTAQSKIGDPMMVALYVAEIVSKCTVILSFMYQVTKKSAKLKAATGRLDKLPGAIRAAARVKGFGKVE